jgi:hypothetical protein
LISNPFEAVEKGSNGHVETSPTTRPRSSGEALSSLRGGEISCANRMRRERVETFEFELGPVVGERETSGQVHKTFGCRQCRSSQDQISRPLRPAFFDLKAPLYNTSAHGNRVQGEDLGAPLRGILQYCWTLPCLCPFQGRQAAVLTYSICGSNPSGLSIPSWEIMASNVIVARRTFKM